MADAPDFLALARAITTAAGRVADPDRRYPFAETAEQLARDLCDAWPKTSADWYEGYQAALDDNRDAAVPLSPVDTPEQHRRWALDLLAQIELDPARLGDVARDIADALGHLRRAEILDPPNPGPQPEGPALTVSEAASALLAAARGLRSESGENPEYDRALVELIRDTIGGDYADIARSIDLRGDSFVQQVTR